MDVSVQREFFKKLVVHKQLCSAVHLTAGDVSSSLCLPWNLISVFGWSNKHLYLQQQRSHSPLWPFLFFLERLQCFGLEKTQLKTNTAFRSIDNTGVAGRGCSTFLPIWANILGHSALNVITGEITISHVQRGVGDWLLGLTLMLWNSLCYCGSSTKCISQNSKAQVWPGLYFQRRFTSEGFGRNRPSCSHAKQNSHCCKDINLRIFQWQNY